MSHAQGHTLVTIGGVTMRADSPEARAYAKRGRRPAAPGIQEYKAALAAQQAEMKALRDAVAALTKEVKKKK